MSARAFRSFAAAASVVAVCSIFALASADATRVVKIPSHISIKSNGLKFSGKVTSPRTPCLGGRKVTLLRTNGNVLGHTTTNASGHWKITAQGSAGITLGRFYAKVKRRSDGTAGTIYVCKAAKSPKIRFHS